MSHPRLPPGKRAAPSLWLLCAEQLKGAEEEQSSDRFTPASLLWELFCLCRDMHPFNLETALQQKESLLGVLTSPRQSKSFHGLPSLSVLIVCSRTHLTAPTPAAFVLNQEGKWKLSKIEHFHTWSRLLLESALDSIENAHIKSLTLRR